MNPLGVTPNRRLVGNQAGTDWTRRWRRRCRHRWLDKQQNHAEQNNQYRLSEDQPVERRPVHYGFVRQQIGVDVSHRVLREGLRLLVGIERQLAALRARQQLARLVGPIARNEDLDRADAVDGNPVRRAKRFAPHMSGNAVGLEKRADLLLGELTLHR